VHGADDHRRAAAHRQPGQCGFVAHALRQARSIGHGGFIIRVGQVTTATQRWAQATVVDGDDRLQAGHRINAQVQRFKAGAVHERKHQ